MRYVLKIKPEINEVIATGTNAHLLFYHFYIYTDSDEIWELRDDIQAISLLLKKNMKEILPEPAQKEVEQNKPIRNILVNFLKWEIQRTGAVPVTVTSITKDEEEQKIDKELDMSDSVAIPAWQEGARVRIQLKREADLIMPRATAIVRHTAR